VADPFGFLSVLERAPDDVVLVAPGRAWRACEILDALGCMQRRLVGCRVLGVLADNSPSWIIADLACKEAGAIHVPLPGFFSPDQLRHALEQSAADTVLTDQPERVGALDLGFGITGRWQQLVLMRRAIEPAALPAGTAKICFTSGSTGAPKGACLSSAGLHATARALRDRLADLPLARHLVVLPLALLLENVAGVYGPLLSGITVHVPPLASVGWRGVEGFDASSLHATVSAAEPGSLILVPELLKAWTLFLAQSGRRPPESLRFVAVGGARVAPELLVAARRAGIPAYQGYGITEGGSVLALNRPGDDGDGVGRPLDHVALSIESGELVAQTSGFLGYAGDTGRFDGRLATGDLGSLDDRGHVHLAGRRSNLLITSYGRNISPEWIEARLLAEPLIRQVLVGGDEKAALCAVVVPAPGAGQGAVHEAIARVNATLPDYARVAHIVVARAFTAENGLATGNGRPRRAQILARYAAEITAAYPPEEHANVVL
jgi:long-chain acyl-CoA synthetase